MRDLDEKPYSPDEQRVAKFFADAGTGGGDDPIGAILASHAYLAAKRNQMRKTLTSIVDFCEEDGVSAVERLRAIRNTAEQATR